MSRIPRDLSARARQRMRAELLATAIVILQLAILAAVIVASVRGCAALRLHPEKLPIPTEPADVP